MSKFTRQHPEAIEISTWDRFKSKEHPKLSYVPNFRVIWMKNFLEKIENFLSPEMPNRAPQHPEAIGIPTWDLFRSNEHQKLSYAPKFQIVWMKTVARARVRVFRASPDSTRKRSELRRGTYLNRKIVQSYTTRQNFRSFG